MIFCFKRVHKLYCVEYYKMGNNYYIDESEGDVNISDIENYSHIGKFTFRDGRSFFIFYISRDIQISRLQQMNMNQTVIDEFGSKKTVDVFLQQISNLSYIEDPSEFS